MVDYTNLKIVANEMLPIYETSNKEKVVDARELHEQLVVAKDFTSWIKDRIEKFGFLEGEDFSPILVKTSNGRPRTDYLLSLDTAKEISMVQNNEMGRQVRRYFIEVEKRYKQREPRTHAEFILQQAQQMVDFERQQKVLNEKLISLESGMNTITNNLTAVPDQKKVIDNVNEYARWARLGHNEIYNRVYTVMKAKHGIDIPSRVENERRKINAEHYEKTGKLYANATLKKKVNGIDVMVRIGVLDKFNTILVGFLSEAKGSPLSVKTFI
ncbi:antA/AntB antirepressor family protein [Metabacillus litoralis]|uniref:antA/AntB antirepressor family protein n=1 Tax=Metabacillus litoralis TaxID=152268 RepID=UPI002040CA15|nr:antA/AntB antirepressor family protein [Metabacillus litoralis]MCM3165114.1 antA/AntB antirepressor family protein [Metabacillus litoralis]